ncbi:MAG: hypothetical protein A2V69_00590 [Candidatus Portnoybacteria bacterium RBG_13_40_8]|uniref:SIR2-like domain-containing protein n=1 Tax=Candidatus Portnoybacteria bacterium RBG_13_40_8 TaxID=1801990 RepID=A0A1G2F1T1_9BACT|nr:MAG: hypothetical protein A2V69_00590 [Candidatus Portnoybacteria bacterium RBG_13_40_8]OGZ35187.1 MAG: hypothetical protein A2V60_02105 [Candidatus Portnoybacteria bacterium RIFCSPHIGHO2_01_FULL_39_19]
MAYPVIILGAGASNDYIDLDKRYLPRQRHLEDIRIDLNWQPPLGNDLFDTRFEKTIRGFPQVRLLASSIYSSNKELEDRLSELVENAVSKERIQKELLSFEFYLQNLFIKISENYKRPLNNYATLIKSVHDFTDRNNKVCFATFNYDLLLDECLEEELNDKRSDTNSELPAYVKNPIKLIKLHGSCDWGYPLPNSFELEPAANKEELYKILMKDWNFLTNHKISLSIGRGGKIPIYRSKNYYIENETKDRRLYLFPAVAIPLPQKDFICPESHIKELETALGETDKILIIGWKAGDQRLINIMENTIKKPVMITIVSKGENDIDEIKKKLSRIDKISFFNTNQNGFSDFIQKGEHEKFLSIDPSTI